jgi:hypothetical protein
VYHVLEGKYESNASIFFSENVIAITVKFTWFIHTSFTNMRPSFSTESL